MLIIPFFKLNVEFISVFRASKYKKNNYFLILVGLCTAYFIIFIEYMDKTTELEF